MLRSSLLKPEDDNTEFTKTVKKRFRVTWLTVTLTLTKTNFWTWPHLWIPDSARHTFILRWWNMLRRELWQLLNLPTDKTTPEPGPAMQVNQDEEAQPGPTLKKRSLASFFQKKDVPSSLSQVDRDRTELETYLLIPEAREGCWPTSVVEETRRQLSKT